jgi:hypothetical protein
MLQRFCHEEKRFLLATKGLFIAYNQLKKLPETNYENWKQLSAEERKKEKEWE